ncbi:hypothetical protein BJ508DRAFT_336167 [Ascobolus immersus RN42]|uniref:Ubiquitin-like domain-containing protein n=1 Tax=Ascobolus immersus RN42 TaxID=1160509 RepID=A0A3N4H9K2_ASCIM|nr:hypothetical protein BJ508DRAFT_336167 [Ascobolus immersus RN42]
MQATVHPVIEPFKYPTTCTQVTIALHPTNRSFSFTIPTTDATILTIKEAITAITGIAPLHQHLSEDGIPLPSNLTTLEDWNCERSLLNRFGSAKLDLILKDQEIPGRFVIPGSKWRRLWAMDRPGYDMMKALGHPDNQFGPDSKIAFPARPTPSRTQEEIDADPVPTAYYYALPKLNEKVIAHEDARRLKGSQKS